MIRLWLMRLLTLSARTQDLQTLQSGGVDRITSRKCPRITIILASAAFRPSCEAEHAVHLLRNWRRDKTNAVGRQP